MPHTVSVVIPAHNGERTIARAVETVTEQDVPEIEVLVVDDGSTDATTDIVKGLAGVTLISQERTGVAGARNTGLRAATGRYVAFLDCDDEWCAGKLQKQLAVLDGEPSVGVVASAAVAVDDVGRTRIINAGNVRGRIASLLLYRNIIVTSSVVLRRSCLDGLQPWFRQELSGRGAAVEDWEFWTRLAARYSFVVSSEPLVRYRTSSQSNFNQHHVDELKQLWRSAYAALRSDPVLGAEVARQWRSLDANVDFFAGCAHFEAGRAWQARREMIRSAIRAPLTPNWRSVLSVLFTSPHVRDLVKTRLIRR